MERRNFLKKTTLAAATATAATVAGSFSKPAIAQGKRQLKLTLGFPKGFPGFGDFIVEIAKRIEAVSDGKLSIKVYGAGELVGPFEGIDATAKGVVDMYYSASYYFQAKSKAMNFFTSIPFGMTTLEHFAWMKQGGGGSSPTTFTPSSTSSPLCAAKPICSGAVGSTRRSTSPRTCRG